MRRLLRIGAILAAVATACTGFARPAAAETVTLLAGPVGGVWYIIAAGMAKVIHDTYPNLLVRVEPGGAVANPARISAGTADFALAIATPAVMAMRGEAMYHQKYPNVRAVAFGFAPSYLQIIAQKDFPFPSLGAAIKAKYPLRIAGPSTATLGHWMALQVLSHYGATPGTLRGAGSSIVFVSHSQQQNLMRNRQANVLLTLLPAPGTDITLVASSVAVKFLPLEPGLVKMLVQKDAAQPAVLGHKTYPDVIPAGAKVRTIIIGSGLIVSPKVPEKIVYEVTRALFEHASEVAAIHPSMKDFTPSALVGSGPRGNGAIPLAAGAIRYFKKMRYDYK